MARLKVATEADASPSTHPPLDHEDASTVHSLMIAAQTAEEMGDCADIRTALLLEVRRYLRREQFQSPIPEAECPSP